MTLEQPLVNRLASGQKLAILAVILGLVGNLYWPVMFISLPLMLYSMFRMSHALRLSTVATTLLLIAMFVPVVGLICLLAVNARATSRLREAGIKVGLLGARTKDLPVEGEGTV
jgi:hypothetical protein